jgi:hypothetical protein
MNADLFQGRATTSHFAIWLWCRDCGLKTTHQIVVLMAIALRADNITLTCNPSVQRIMEDTKLSRTKVFETLRELCDGGVLGLTSGAKKNQNNTYSLRLGSTFTPPDVREADIQTSASRTCSIVQTSATRTSRRPPRGPKEVPVREPKASPCAREAFEHISNEGRKNADVKPQVVPTVDEARVGDWENFPVSKEAVVHILKQALPDFLPRLNGSAPVLTPEVLAGVYRIDRADGFAYSSGPGGVRRRLDSPNALQRDIVSFLRSISGDHGVGAIALARMNGLLGQKKAKDAIDIDREPPEWRSWSELEYFHEGPWQAIPDGVRLKSMRLRLIPLPA